MPAEAAPPLLLPGADPSSAQSPRIVRFAEESVPNAASSPRPFSNRLALIGIILSIREPLGSLVTIRHPPEEEHLWMLHDATLSSLLLPMHDDMHGTDLEVVVNDVRFMGVPIRLPGSSLTNPSFSLVLVLDASCDVLIEESRSKLSVPPTQLRYGHMFEGSRAVLEVYRRAARTLAHALLNAELLSGFVSSQARSLSGLFQDVSTMMTPKDLSPNFSGANLGFVSPAVTSPKDVTVEDNTDHRQAQDRAVASSELGMFLATVYDSLVERGHCDISLNQCVFASVTLTDPRLAPTQVIRPYHSLLLMPYPLPLDATPAMRRVAELFDRSGPTKSLGDAADELEMGFDEMATFVDHLCRWGRARLLITISERSLFFVSPGIDVADHSASFSARFPKLELARVLAGVCQPKADSFRPRRLLDMTELGADGIPVFEYLLRRGLVTQVKQFIYFVPNIDGPTPLHKLASLPMSRANQDLPAGLNEAQREYLRMMWDPDDQFFKLLLKASPLFGGQHHVAEICFRLNVARKAIDSLCIKYADALVVAMHEM